MIRHGLICLSALFLILAIRPAWAGKKPTANVPPGDEIEVLDPNADSLGRPTVELVERGEAGVEVEIPQTVLVHKYYYTGDRSFQAQLLPGGPTVIVVNHPKTNERLYLDTQMMPGAPRVTYTSHSIEYDFGDQAVCVKFPPLLKPRVIYRNGPSITQRVENIAEATNLPEGWNRLKSQGQSLRQTSGLVLGGMLAGASRATETITLPAQNLLQTLPGGKVVFNPDWKEELTVSVKERKREVMAKEAEYKSRLEDLSIKTLR